MPILFTKGLKLGSAVPSYYKDKAVLISDAQAGATEIEIDCTSGFKHGDTIRVGLETHKVLDEGSLVLDQPLNADNVEPVTVTKGASSPTFMGSPGGESFLNSVVAGSRSPGCDNRINIDGKFNNTMGSFSPGEKIMVGPESNVIRGRSVTLQMPLGKDHAKGTLVVSKKPPPPVDEFDRIDFNGDGVITRAEFEFYKMDTNHDGVIEKAEWDAARMSPTIGHPTPLSTVMTPLPPMPPTPGSSAFPFLGSLFGQATTPSSMMPPPSRPFSGFSLPRSCPRLKRSAPEMTAADIDAELKRLRTKYPSAGSSYPSPAMSTFSYTSEVKYSASTSSPKVP